MTARLWVLKALSVLDPFFLIDSNVRWTIFTKQVGMESEGFAIYDSLMQLKNEVMFYNK